MDIRSLRYFVEVAEQNSFTRAAARLHVTQPTVSKMIAQLEQSLDLPLLDRVGKKFTLTDAGKVVLARAHELLALHAELKVELRDLQQLERGELRMGVSPQTHMAIAPWLAEYHQRYPGIELKMVESGTQAIERDLRKGTVELGTMLDYPGNAASWQEFESLPLVRSPLCLLAPPASIWQGRHSVGLSELADSPFVFYGDTFALNEIVLDACQRAGFVPRMTSRSGQWDFIASLVRLGVGVCLLPKMFCDTLDASQFAIVPLLDPPVEWNLMLAWRRTGRLSFAARAWLDLVRAHMAAHTQDTARLQYATATTFP
ncbi:LysR substrate-binding domain-containing protein [Janthinobacterium sp.]|uniref:LysR substrate-binding domain-containing protein n=1 Tax=Janthinobacterium sp. TaxID=1871054 RepID=UPI002897A6D6|nr:LysR substrate-binding domain-containing protein [Janthinobacterium sp.]